MKVAGEMWGGQLEDAVEEASALIAERFGVDVAIARGMAYAVITTLRKRALLDDAQIAESPPKPQAPVGVSPNPTA